MKNQKLYVKSGRKLLTCERCGTVRTPVVYDKEFYFDFLNNFYDVTPSTISPDMPLKAGMRMLVLNSAAKMTGSTPKSLLEVSSYDGVTLSVFLRNYPGATVKGIEPTVAAVDFAERVFPDLKGKMYRESFEMHQFAPSERFDAVIFSLSFLMILDPLGSLRKLRPQVNPGGIVLMNEGGYVNDMLTAGQAHWPVRYFFTQKTFFYTYQSLRYLMARAGFRYLMTMRFDQPDMASTFHAFTPDDSVRPDELDLVASKSVFEGAAAYFRAVAPTEDVVKKYLREVG